MKKTRYILLISLLLAASVVWASASNDNFDMDKNVPYDKLLFLLDGDRQLAINTYGADNYRCKDEDSFKAEYAAWLDHQDRFNNDDYLIIITPDPNKFLTEAEIASGFMPWTSGNELKTEEVCRRAYPVISEAIKAFTVGEVFNSIGFTQATIDTDRITPQMLAQLLCIDSIFAVRIVVKPISVDATNELQSDPNTFTKVAIASGIASGVAVVISVVLLAIYNYNKRNEIKTWTGTE